MNANPHSTGSADPAESQLDLSVIVSSVNRVPMLARAVNSLFAQQDLPAAAYEVIVVVAGADRNRIEYLRSLRPACSLRIIEELDRGFGVALNQAIASARGSVVLFTDDYLVLHPGNFSAHLSAQGAGDSRVVYGSTLVAEQANCPLMAQWARENIDEKPNPRATGLPWPHDASVSRNYSISHAKLLASGGFDDTFSWRCHDELGVRLAKMGFSFFHEPKAISSLVCGRTAEQMVRIEARGRGKEEISFLRKHPEQRPHSVLARFADTPSDKWLATQVAARFPISPDSVLRPAFALASSFQSQPWIRRVGLRLLRARCAISFLRGAAESVGWPELQAEVGRRLPVLMYHHVGPPQPDSEPALFVSAARFETHLRFLTRKGYRGIGASDWLSWVRDAKPLPEKSVLLTFDDAIADLYEHAFPVLERYGFNAVVFVPTNCVSKGNLWNHSLGYKWRPCLSAEQIQYWSAKGFEFGAHSRNHPDLTKLNDSELLDEVAGSRIDLEKIVHVPVNSFAYPYGDHNSAATLCVGEQFDLGFTTEEGLNTLRTDRSLLRRCTVFEWDTLLDLDLMLRLGWNPIRRLKIRQRFRGLKRRLKIGTP